MSEERTGKFDIRRIKNKSNDNYRTIAFEGPEEDAKQVGSTFDEEIADKLAAYPEGADITLEIDKSGRFWDIVGARLADESDISSVRSSKKEVTSKQNTFSERDLTFFMGNSARVVAAYVASSSEYRDKIKDSKDPIEALHMDIVLGAKILLNKANE